MTESNNQTLDSALGDGISLAPQVWPSATSRNADGSLCLENLSVNELAQAYGTPLFVLSEREFRGRAAAFRQAAQESFTTEIAGTQLADAEVFYGSKAFLCAEVARWAVAEGLGIDVCSGGELAVALRAQVPPERIALHGNNKLVPEIRRGVHAGVGRIVIDSLQEIDRVAAEARAQGVRQPVLLRVSVGVDAHTHEFIQTANIDQKFGLALATGDAQEGVQAILGCPDELDLRGFHSHIGSQILDFESGGFAEAATRLLEFHARMEREFNISLPEMDLGGGFGIAYTAADTEPPISHVMARLAAIVAEQCARLKLAPPKLSFEPGRSIVGPAMITLYQVGTTKDVTLDDGSTRRYVSVDGGMSDNIRTALYAAQYSAVLAGRTSDVAPQLCRVVGKHCESGDIVVRDVYLPGDLRPGDIIAVAATGAYGYSLASNYNHVPRPAVVAVAPCDDISNPTSSPRIIIRRETEADLLRLDVS